MKNLKKVFVGVLVLAMFAGVLAGCAGDPVADEFEKFLNTDMVDVNANYEKIKTESGKWESLETGDAIAENISEQILPTIEDSLDKLSKIELQTEEVKSIKDKYEKVMTTYKEGYTQMLEALKNDDEALADKASAKFDEGIKLLDEYNGALEALASEKNMTVEY